MTKPKTAQIKIAKLSFDSTIYPRSEIPSHHTAEIAEALRTGVTMPPIVVDATSLRIVDGVNRWRACKTVFGPDSEIEAELRTYASEQDLFLDAVRLNADHGLPYSSFERTRNILLAEQFGIPEKEIAAALHIRVEKVEKMKANKTAVAKIGSVPLKRSMNWVGPGATLTEKQTETNRTAGGMSPLYYVNQLIAMLESGLWDKCGEQVQGALRQLYTVLDKIVRDRKTA